MDARPAVMRQTARPLATSQGAPQGAREQGGTPTRIAQMPECDEERKEWNDWAGSNSEEPEATRRPDRRSRNP